MRIIAGKYRGKKLFSPQNIGVRPTSDRARESIFNILNSRSDKEWGEYHLLDLFAGTGAFALEAISRGVADATLVDINLETIRKNLSLFVAEQQKIKVIKSDVANLGKSAKKYNLVFIDAPYNKGLSEVALNILKQNHWLENKAMIIVETEKNEKLPLPDSFELVDERIYGLARVSFMQYIG